MLENDLYITFERHFKFLGELKNKSESELESMLEYEKIDFDKDMDKEIKYILLKQKYDRRLLKLEAMRLDRFKKGLT